jgi:hypothetical protein
MLSTLLKYIEEKHACPHCSGDLSLCHAPAVHVGDGLGWGSEYLFICLNDNCPLFTKGWDYIANQYGHVGSYRHMEIPNSKETYNMMVVGKEAFTGSIIDIEDVKRKSEGYQRQQEALAAFNTCVEQKQLEPVLTILLDDSVSLNNRKRAADLLVALNDISCIEPLRNHTFSDPHLEQEVNLAIGQVLANNFLTECPYCKELIKSRATVCKHCQRELAA